MIQGLSSNLHAGARLVFLRAVGRDAFAVDVGQAVLLYVLSLAFMVLTAALLGLGAEAPTPIAWHLHAVDAAAFLAGALAIALIQGAPAKAKDFVVVVAAASISLYLLTIVIVAPLAYLAASVEAGQGVTGATALFLVAGLLSIAIGVWALVVMFRAIGCVFEVTQTRALLLWLVFVVIGAAPGYLVEQLTASA